MGFADADVKAADVKARAENAAAVTKNFVIGTSRNENQHCAGDSDTILAPEGSFAAYFFMCGTAPT
jgi:hypothetical protein